MAAEVSSFLRILNSGDMNESSRIGSKSPTSLVTKDLLGGCSTLDSKELDLDVKVPSGWEKRLNLESGKVYLQRCNSPNNLVSSEQKQQNNEKMTKFQDLNYPPALKKKPLNLFDDISLDLKLVPSTPPPSSSNYLSVCTLDKVKFALERAEKETTKKRSLSSMSKAGSASSPSSNSSSSIDQDENTSATFFATACHSCLLYVLVSKSDPKCPRCSMVIQSPSPLKKKPRIDLNISI